MSCPGLKVTGVSSHLFAAVPPLAALYAISFPRLPPVGEYGHHRLSILATFLPGEPGSRPPRDAI